MDNAPCRTGLFPERAMRYLAPYSPFLNPIEKYFSANKANLKHILNDIVQRRDVAAATASWNITTKVQGTAAHSVYGNLLTGCDALADITSLQTSELLLKETS